MGSGHVLLMATEKKQGQRFVPAGANLSDPWATHRASPTGGYGKIIKEPY